VNHRIHRTIGIAGSPLVVVPLAVAGLLSTWHALRPSWTVPLPTPGNLAEERMQDFRDALYFPIREFLDGGNPYDPAAMFAHWPVRQDFNLYQPYHLLLHAPFALFGYRAGAVAFAVVSALLLVLLAAMAVAGLRRWVAIAPVPGTIAVATLLITSQVGKAQLFVGQVNPLVAVGAAGALMTRSTHPRWASVCLALAWLKPQFGFPLAVLLLARGSRRVALAGTAIAAAASLPVVLLLIVRGGGIGPFADVIAANLTHARHTDYGAVDSLTAQRVDLPAVLFRGAGWTAPGVEPVALVVMLLVSVLLVRRLDRLDVAGGSAVADLLTCLAVVVAVVHQPGDVLIAVPALAVAAAAWWRHRRDGAWWLLGFAVVALAVPFAHLYFVDRAVDAVLGATAAVTVDGFAVVVCWALLMVFGLRLTRREPVLRHAGPVTG
jgi:hypothetical protein